MSWTRVVRDKFPHHHRCVCCPELAEYNDIVITVPVLRNGVTLATAIIHQRCLATFMEGVPTDLNVARLRVGAIVQHFSKNSI